MRYSVSDKAPTPPPAPSDEPKEPLPSPLSTPKPDQKTPNFNKPKTDTVIDDTISTKEDLVAKVDDNDEQHDDSDSEGELHIDMGSQEFTAQLYLPKFVFTIHIYYYLAFFYLFFEYS